MCAAVHASLSFWSFSLLFFFLYQFHDIPFCFENSKKDKSKEKNKDENKIITLTAFSLHSPQLFLLVPGDDGGQPAAAALPEAAHGARGEDAHQGSPHHATGI